MIVVGQPLAPPRLRGTDSQIAWALRIRAEILPEIHAIRDGSAGRLRIGTLSSEEAEGYSAIVEAADTLIAEERAGWWIDRRGHSTHSLLQERVEAACRAASVETRPLAPTRGGGSAPGGGVLSRSASSPPTEFDALATRNGGSAVSAPR